MPILKYLEIAARLDSLISRKATGTPSMLAERMQVSKRMLHVYLSELRKMGAPIDYDNLGKSYYYKREYKLDLASSIRKLQNDR